MTIETVKEYYGKTLTGSGDLKTDACCDASAIPEHVKAALSQIHDEVLTRYYGCGLVIPEKIEGMRILDLGCGAGRDAYALAKLAGPEGHVTGVDMTPEQLAVARKHVGWHMERFGHAATNIDFREGYIEELGSLGLEPQSFDIIVSNCVVNLSPDKRAVLEGARGLLKPGGEFYFADVYADRRLDAGLREDPVLLGECLGGALYWNDFQNLAREAGFGDPRLVRSPLPCRWAGTRLRGLRPGGDLPWRHRACRRDVRAGRAPRDRERPHLPRLRQHVPDVEGKPLRAAFRLHRRFLAPFRHLSGLRHGNALCRRGRNGRSGGLLLSGAL